MGISFTEEEIARILSRGRVSGIGIYSFKMGGFIVDGGRKKDKLDSIPPCIFRRDFPEDWFFVIGVPHTGINMSGQKEVLAFNKIERPSKKLVGELSKIILMKMLPAIVEEDIISFGESITELDFKFGEYWIKVQGGLFSHPTIGKGIEYLLESGAYGAGQSSWGPVFYGLVEGTKQAKDLSEGLSDFLENGYAFYTEANNGGASIEIIKNK
jgi:beta-ribofuranosylaminobenzene 5'-phosphate synthase